MINKLREQNKMMLYKFTKENDLKAINKHRIIQELLKYDDCFSRLSFEEAYTILKSLNVENWKDAYAKLLSTN